MTNARNPDNFPDDVKTAADNICSIVNRFEQSTFAGSEASDNDLLEQSVTQWGLKEFARYFLQMCVSSGVPYVLKYVRDVQSVKQIKADLSSVGRASNDDLKSYIDWAFDHRDMITEKDGYFTLGTIQKHVNHFLQSLPSDDSHRPSWGDALGPLMLEEYNANKVV